jgi:DNA adenine methylase
MSAPPANPPAAVPAPAAVPVARPFLKWAGGKTQLLGAIAPRLPAGSPPDHGTYHEPFLGGAALFFHLRPKKARLTDANGELINAYLAVRDHVERLIAELTELAGRTQSRDYYEIREWAPSDKVQQAARLIYLNKTCYNGLYRVNRAGRFNVPYGRYTKPRVCDAENLRACSAALKNVDIAPAGFESVLEVAAPGDFVYFDPPYQPVSIRSFTAYHNNSFGEQQQRELAGAFRALSKKGVKVMLSNSDSNFIRELYQEEYIRIVNVPAKRSINSVGSERGQVGEVLVMNYQPPAAQAPGASSKDEAPGVPAERLSGSDV